MTSSHCPLCLGVLLEREVVCTSCGYAVGQDADSLPLGTMVASRYRVESVLGVGGFGVTYRAFDQANRLPIALKELVPPGSRRLATGFMDANRTSAGAAAVTRFLHEGEILRQIEHPNVVRIFDHFNDGESAFIVMEFLDGETLESNLAVVGRWMERETTELIRSLCDALRVVHDKNFLHRDVKPANIMLVKERGPVLIDFGSSRTATTTQTAALTQIVTPGYAAPEQYGSRGRVGPYTDIYALGSVVYNLLTGDPPPAATDRLAHDEIVSLATHLKLTTGLGVAADQALSLRALDRPATVDELLRIIGTYKSPAIEAAENEPSEVPTAVELHHDLNQTLIVPRSTVTPSAITPPTVDPIREPVSVQSSVSTSPSTLPHTVKTVPEQGATKSRSLQKLVGLAFLIVVVGVGTASVFLSRRTSSLPGTTAVEPARTTASQAIGVPGTTVPPRTTTGETSVPSIVASDQVVVTEPTSVIQTTPPVFSGPIPAADAFVGLVFRSESALSIEMAAFVRAEQKKSGKLRIKECDLTKRPAKECLTEWLSAPGIVAMIGPTKNDDAVAMSAVTNAGVPTLLIGPQRQSLTDERSAESLFRLTPNVSQIGADAGRKAKGKSARVLLGTDPSLVAAYEPARSSFISSFNGKISDVLAPFSSVVAQQSAADIDTLVTFGLTESEVETAVSGLGSSWNGEVFVATNAANMKGKNCGVVTLCKLVDAGVTEMPYDAKRLLGKAPANGSWAVVGADAYDMVAELFDKAFMTSASASAIHKKITDQIQTNGYSGRVGAYTFDEHGTNTASQVALFQFTRKSGVADFSCLVSPKVAC
jgi:serine/threonine protein kinase